MNAKQLALEALKAMLSNYEGVFDCIDNAGERYQSQAAADAEQLTREAIAALESELAQVVEPVTREALLGAIARGWCSPKNSHKEMDSDLALAIGDEVAKLYTAPQPAAPEPVNAWIAVGDGLPDIGTPVMAMCGLTKPEMYPMMRGDDCDGWLWEAHRSGPIDDPRSYEADDDYEVVAWTPLPKKPGATP